jgi:RNA polymerase sigma-70 factor (ECF subfamily)
MSRSEPLHAADLERARAAAAGDDEAFRAIFDHAFPRLYRFALARTREPAAAEEATQVALCLAFERLGRFRGEASLLTWMTTILRRELSARSQQAARVRPVPFDEEASWFESLASELEGADAELERAELEARVHQVLDWLPAREAQLLAWKYFDEVPLADIARRLDIGFKAAESRLHRARQAFRDEFATLARLDLDSEPSR